MAKPWIRSVGAAAVLLLFTAPVNAQEPSPLALVPAKAPVVFQLKGVDSVRDRLEAMLSKAAPDVAGPFSAHFAEMLKQGPLADRDLSKLPKGGTVLVVVTDLNEISGDPPALAFILPTDYATFKKSLLTPEEAKGLKKADDGAETAEVGGKAMFFLDMKTHVVATLSEELIPTFAKKFDTLESKLGQAASEAFLKPDVAVMLNLGAVNELYGEQIQAFKGLFELGLGNVEGMDKATQEMAKMFVNGLFQVIDDGKGLIFSVDFRPEGLSAKFSLAFKDGTPSNDFLAKLKLSPFDGLAKMPAGQMSYSGTRMDPALSKLFGRYLTDILAVAEDADAAKAIKTAVEKLAANATGVTYGVSNIPTSGIEVVEYKDPEAAIETFLAMMKAIPKDGKFGGTALKGAPKIVAKAETHRGFALSAVSLQLDLEKALDSQPGITDEMKEGMVAAMKKMFGGDKMNLWVGTDGKQFVQISAPDWKAGQKLLDDLLDGKSIGKNEAFALTRKQLPAEATNLTLMETGRMVVGMYEYMGAILQAVPGFPLQNLPPVKAPKSAPTFLGIALVMKKDLASGELFVPAGAVQQLRDIIVPLLQNQVQ